MFRRSGLLVPDDVAYADLFLQDTFRTFAGARAQCARVGELAVEMLAAQLEANVFGLPEVPTVTSVSAEWRDGDSLPLRVPRRETVDLSGPVLTHNLVA